MPYRVLARKYRPDDFDTLIGQDAMVRTLSNAVKAGRLAHAFVLTGVRGVGKTTTARIIAKALNCQSSDGPTLSPCGTCDACTSIAESRHVDVLEMDAASRTGIGDVREIIDSVRYAPVSARFKVYIIDEVHMLSTAAFNALLKTLEEPPEHVKFIFATTEIRKIPVTVLSRCQRFDLKRVEGDVLAAHLARIAKSEGAEVDAGALALIARAAEGSVRDSLSLLDQAIAHTGGHITEETVRDMLGLADRTRVLDLFEMVMKGDVVSALTLLREQYDTGADPVQVIGDLMDVTHYMTRLKVVPEAGSDATVSEAERALGTRMAAGLSMAALTRAWQMLLKGLSEVRVAPSPIAAAEMVLIRLMYAASLPDPSGLVKKLTSPQAGTQMVGQSAPPSASMGGAAGHGPQAGYNGPGTQASAGSGPMLMSQAVGNTVVALHPHAASDMGAGGHAPHPMPVSFEKMVELFTQEREGILANVLTDHVRIVSYAPGKISINPSPRAPQDLSMRLKHCLKTWTGVEWMITITREGDGRTTLRQDRDRDAEALRAKVIAEPAVKAFMTVFGGAELRGIRPRVQEEGMMGDAGLDALSTAQMGGDTDGDDFDY